MKIKFNSLSQTSNIQLKKIASDLGIRIKWIGFKQDLPKQKFTKDTSYIINIGDDNKGTHWVVLSVDPQGNCYYFDSYGAPALDEVHQFCGSHPLWVNKTQFQGIHEGHCGIWALLFARAVQDKKVKQFLNQFTILGKSVD
jgi:hypothetical protein